MLVFSNLSMRVTLDPNPVGTNRQGIRFHGYQHPVHGHSDESRQCIEPFPFFYTAVG
jgi:hypothetical protein